MVVPEADNVIVDKLPNFIYLEETDEPLYIVAVTVLLYVSRSRVPKL